jgi:ABC-type transport system involved in cytochrome c biogenesis permease subunit
MSVTALPSDKALPRAAQRRGQAITVEKVFSWILQDFASLQLTVILFLLGIFVIWVGTTAQADADIWLVVDRYFRSFFMEVSFKYVFPAQFFPAFLHNLPGQFHAPGGMCVGLMMMLNLLAAHLWRFKIQASGTRLLLGLGMTSLGVLITFLVIASGHNSQGLQGVPIFSWGQMWIGFLFLYMAGVIGGGAALASWAPAVWDWQRSTQQQRVVFGLGAGVLAILAAVWCFLLSTGIRVPDEGLRIVWQLMMGILGTIPLLIGCILVFKQRGGIVVIHAGIALMMFGELFVSLYAVENQARMAEGQVVNYVYDVRNTELAITRKLGNGQEEVFAIPRSKLLTSAATKSPIQDERLPFEVQVVNYFENSTLRRAKSKDKLPYTKGAAFDSKIALVDLPASKGTDGDAPVDEGGMYVKFLEKESGNDLGTYALSQKVTSSFEEPFEDQVTVGKEKYGVSLRFQRSYRPYSLRLVDARGDKFAASQITKNFSSDVHLVDPTRNTDRSVHIWMNNPLRFAGETFYQSGFGSLSQSKDYTILSVVTNTGWMIPYVACMIVAIGLVSHFLITLARFLKKTLESDREIIVAEVIDLSASPALPVGKRGRDLPSAPALRPQAAPFWRNVNVILSGAAVLAASLVFIVWLMYWLAPPKFTNMEMNLAGFGRLPVLDDGRVKPFDTVARNSARTMSGSFYERVKNDEGKRTHPVEWLLDSITASPTAKKYKLFKIESREVVETLGLDARPGDWCYSIEEIGGTPLAVLFRLENAPQGDEDLAKLMKEFERGKYNTFVKEAEAAAALRRQKQPVSDYQAQLLKLADRLEDYRKLVHSFEVVSLPPVPSEEEMKQDPTIGERWQGLVQRINQRIEALRDEKPVHAVAMAPDEAGKERWQPYPIAVRDLQKAQIFTNLKKQRPDLEMAAPEPDQPTYHFHRMLEGYRAGDATQFNESLQRYQAELSKRPPEDYSAFKVNLEDRFNGVSPFFMGMFPYALAFLVSIAAIPVWILVPRLRMPLNWTAFTLVVLTLAMHTLALGLRMYISGRPPVTTLYSSAIFIGWAGVIFGVCVELIYRLGIGNILSGVSGFTTLFIAYLLAQDGETMPQLAAVLDTQFWLATHVVCITLGYAATFAAGTAAILYVIAELGCFGYAFVRKAVTGPGERGQQVAVMQRPDWLFQAIGKIVYGIVCFAILFSFVGTVLGGLWADDSWGRFWGWDPKENGALIIVLWNAVVLHARWGGLVKERGLALLAIGGNIVTAWSWFGVNQLGIGLHSYGFNKELVQILCGVVLVHLLIIAIGGLGLLLTKWWWSYAAQDSSPLTP